MMEVAIRGPRSDSADLRDLAAWTGGQFIFASTFTETVIAASSLVDALRRFEQREEVLRRSPAQNAAESLVLDHRLGAAFKMAKIGEADAIDARRLIAFPAPPDEPRRIEQERGFVRQRSSGNDGAYGCYRQDRRAQQAQESLERGGP